MKTISVATRIQAPSEEVWAVLADFEGYPEWNPFMTRISGNLVVGQPLNVRIVPPGARGMTFRPKVTVVEPGRRIEWLGTMGIRGLFDGRHTLALEPTANGSTVFTQTEEFSGMVVPMAGKLLAQTEHGFSEMNDALRRRVEMNSAPTIRPVGGR